LQGDEREYSGLFFTVYQSRWGSDSLWTKTTWRVGGFLVWELVWEAAYGTSITQTVGEQ